MPTRKVYLTSDRTTKPKRGFSSEISPAFTRSLGLDWHAQLSARESQILRMIVACDALTSIPERSVD
ncbi:MAG: hypothetical protein AB7L90_26745 [Hyphomicrobiaceae bacterium]